MKLREMFEGQRSASDMGLESIRIAQDEENLRTPHWTMKQVLDMLEDRPSVMSGLRQIMLFTFSDIRFTSSDQKSAEFANQWLDQRGFLKDEMMNDGLLHYGVGTSYIEPIYKDVAGGDGKVLDAFFHVPDPSMIYRNLDADEGDEDYWIMEVPYRVREFDGREPDKHYISYIRGDRLWQDWIWGIGYPKEKFIQRQHGWSRTPHYGWGVLCSAVDNEEVIQEIVKNWSLMAKYRSIGKKIISFLDSDGESVTPEELQNVKEDFANLGEEESMITNKQFEAEDLNFTQDNNMQQEIDWLRKENMSTLVPNYMTAFASEATRATAKEAKVPFSLKLKSLQKENENFYTDLICGSLKQEYDFLADDLSMEFGKPELYSKKDLANLMQRAFSNNVATMNEYRESIGLEPVKGGDKWQKDLQDGDGGGIMASFEKYKEAKHDVELTENMEEKLMDSNFSKSSAYQESYQTSKSEIKEDAKISKDEYDASASGKDEGLMEALRDWGLNDDKNR